MEARLLKTFSLTLILVMMMGGAIISVAASEESDAVTVYSLVFEPNNDSDSAVSRSVIGSTTVQLPTQLFNNPDMSDGVESFTYLSGWRLGSPSGTFYAAGDDYEVTGNATFYAEYETVEPVDYKYNSVQTYYGQFRNLKMMTATVGQPFSFSGNFFETSSLEMTSGSAPTLSTMSTSSQSAGTIVPDWLTLDEETYQYSGTPEKPGNYLYQQWFYQVLFGQVCWNTAILINVPSELDDSREVIYDLDGGEWTDEGKQTYGDGSIPVVTGEAIILPDQNDVTTDDGRVLVGWYADDGTGVEPTYALGSAYMVRDSTMKITAHWENMTDVIVYSLDGGSLENVRAFPYDNNEVVTLLSQGVNKEGQTFLGWRPTFDRGIAYAPGLTVMPSGATYIEAYFVPNDTELVTITFNANGGQGTLYTQQVEPGMFVLLPTFREFVKPDHTFAGWQTEDGTKIIDSDLQVTQDVILYAVWEENGGTDPDDPDPDDPNPEPTPNLYRVTFNTNGGSQSYPVLTVEEGSYIGNPGIPTRDGYVFMGWRSLTETDNWDFSTDVVTTDTILQAQWSPHFTISTSGSVITITLSAEWRDMAADIYWDDDLGDNEPSSIGVSVGTASHDYASDQYGQYAVYGYIVVTSHDSQGQWTSRMPFSIQGQHIPHPIQYEVTFNPNNGGSYFKETVEIGSPVKKPTDPTWADHKFTGWYYNGKLWDFDNPVESDMTLVASWDDDVPSVDPDPTPGQDEIIPYALVNKSQTETGYIYDGSTSPNAQRFVWIVDEKTVGTDKALKIVLSDYSEGTHKISLTVFSSTNNSNTWNGTFFVPEQTPTPDPEPTWIEKNWPYVVCGILAVIVAIILVARFVI